MASSYWVGGTANWDGTAGAKWSATSGGAGGAAVPTASDNVFFDGNSGAVTVTKTTNTQVSSIDFTGFTGTFAGSGTMAVVGGAGGNSDVTLGAGMTLTWTGLLDFNTGRPSNLTSNGISFPGQILMSSAPTLDLQDNFITLGQFEIDNGTFRANGNNVTCSNFLSSNSNSRNVQMGSGTWFLTGTGLAVWDCTTAANLTLSPSTSTIKITDTSNGAVDFRGGGQTYNNIWFARGAGGATNRIYGSNTFNDFKDDGSVAHILLFSNGTTQTVATFSVNGSAGQNITIESDSMITPFLIAKSGGGTIVCNYLTIFQSTASPSSTWYVLNGVDNGNNTGWNFLVASSNSGFLDII